MEPAELFPPAPDFGSGVSRRRIRLTGEPGRVLGELEDNPHGMRCTIEHDGRKVTAVASEFIRIPLTTCLSAGEPLKEIVGTPVGSDFSTFFRGGRARLNCTHMFDLAWLATAHAARGEIVRDYEIEVPDEIGGVPICARLRMNGNLLLEWIISKAVIQSPEALRGRHLFQGFTSWAVAHHEGDALEALMVLQKGCFVAQARRFSAPPGALGAAEKAVNTGLCHGFAAERIDVATRFGDNMRDFTQHPERLLKYQ